jgi:RNA polymerase-binding transcription factor DksA
MIDTDRFRDLLLEERRRVQGAIENIHAENPGSLEDDAGELGGAAADQHLGDVATATFDRELSETLEDNAGAVLGAIDRALGRIEAGTYGMCVRCGREIPEERLEALPYAELCIEDQRALER